MSNPTEAGPATPGAGLAAREAALDLLTGALHRRGGMDEVLGGARLAALPARDRAFARALAMAALRRLGPIDAALQARVRKPPPERVTNILRLGAAQLLGLGTPVHAAVATSVDLAASQAASRPFKGLVNAVLRTLAREPAPDDAELLAPAWLHARWRAAYGPEAARQLMAMIAAEPETDLTLKTPDLDTGIRLALQARPLPGGGLRTALKGDVSTWPGFGDGLWWVQDAAAAIPARLLAATPGESVLDLCAAPGGKTLQLAAAGATVTAVDRSAARLQRVVDNLSRASLNAEIVASDARRWPDPRLFDAVLLDAPCSATGTFRRHPDVLWAAKPSDIAPLAKTQRELLDSAAARVRPAGRLAYCVCSLEPEEGEAQTEAFLQRHPDFALDAIRPGEAGAPGPSLRADGTLRILPHHYEGGLDGFYVARFRRKPS